MDKDLKLVYDYIFKRMAIDKMDGFQKGYELGMLKTKETEIIDAAHNLRYYVKKT